MCNTPIFGRFCRESYNDPEELYTRLRLRGMSMVTITDHDSIDAAECLRGYPHFFLSEEATVTMPSGTEMHLGVYAITERDHTEIQRRRRDFLSLMMYLSERKLFSSVNHVYSGLTGRRQEDDFRWFASYVPAFETRNGQMHPWANAGAHRLAGQLGKIPVAGSDAHTYSGAGRTYTEVPGARTALEFFAGLRAGRGQIHGDHGSYLRLTADVLRIARELIKERPWTALLLPLATFIPAITASHWLNEIRFSGLWTRALETTRSAPRMLWDIDSPWGANWAS